MKKSAKILLLILLLPITISIIFYLTSHYGNPIKRIVAFNEIKEYAKDEFGDLDYTLDNIKYDPQFNLYYSKLNIKDSEDKDFFINYKEGEIFDEREMASSGTNISNRIQPILNDIIYEDPVKSIFKDNLNFCYLTLNNETWDKVEYDITIEEFFQKHTLSLTIYIHNPVSNEKDIINKLKKEYKNLGLNVEKITIAI